MAKTVKKAVKKTAKKATKKAAAKPNPKTTCEVDDVIKLMQRKDGATIADFHEAGYWQPAIAAFKAAERRELKPKKIKKEGEVTRYYASK